MSVWVGRGGVGWGRWSRSLAYTQHAHYYAFLFCQTQKMGPCRACCATPPLPLTGADGRRNVVGDVSAVQEAGQADRLHCVPAQHPPRPAVNAHHHSSCSHSVQSVQHDVQNMLPPEGDAKQRPLGGPRG